MRLRTAGYLFIVVALCAAWPIRSYGQAGNGEITGEVRDSARTSVVGAHVVLREVSTNLSYESATNEDGIFPILASETGNVHVGRWGKRDFRSINRKK